MRFIKNMTEYHKIHTVWKRQQIKPSKIMQRQYSLPEFEFLTNNEWTWTEKIDGTNVRIVFKDGKLTFGGKTDNAQMPVSLMQKLRELFSDKKMEEKMAISDNTIPVVLYGEGFGANIQKGGKNYKADGVDFILFDIKIGRWWLQRKDIEDIANKLGIKTVPVIGRGTLDEMCEFVQKKPNSVFGMFPIEGIVARPSVELFGRNGERIITKIKVKDYMEVK